jgi:3-oxoacyl-[acyl-carrier-protein] synthase II
MPSVVITGLGVCTPLGDGVATNWKNLTGCSVRPVQKTHHVASSEQVRRSSVDGFRQAANLAEGAAGEVLRDAGLWDERTLQSIDPERAGCTVSASKPLFDSSRDSPRPPDELNDLVCSRFGLRGENRNVIAACATGPYAIAAGALWIETGVCDVVLAGSVEPTPHPLIEAGFRQMGVLTSEPVMRPFDLNRTGFVFGAGAGVVVLESEAHARRRGARPHARLSGWALGSDAHSAVAFNSNGQRITEVINRALRRAGLASEDIRHINAHGTATRLNDWVETQALLQAFGPDAQRLMISATKSYTGHLLGAAGSVELVYTVLALQHQYVPATAHLDHPDPACNLDYTPLQGHAATFEHALSLSFGFGGPIGALVVSRC